MLNRECIGSLPDFEHLSSVGARFVAYKNGVRVYFKAPEGREPARGDSATILDQSDPSRRRAAFAFGNAECDWLAMTTLTYHHATAAVGFCAHVEKLTRAFRARWGEPLCGWIKEFQRRGVPHLHLFHSSASIVGQTIANGWRDVRDDGREVARGNFDYWMRDEWLTITGQLGDADARRFNARGIVEFFDSPDAAGRYVAKESAKREQKVLPVAFAEGVGRWWHLARHLAPRPRAWGTMDLHDWPFDVPASLIWEGDAVALCFNDIHDCPKDIADVPLYLHLMGFGPDPRKPDEPNPKSPPKNVHRVRQSVPNVAKTQGDLWA